MTYHHDLGLDHKFSRIDRAVSIDSEMQISGYASYFGIPDQGKDIVQKGAYAKSLQALSDKDLRAKLLWQHDPAQPIGVWDEIYEDDKGLFVKGRLLPDVPRAAEAAALLAAGAMDGLSIGYRTIKAQRGADGTRLLTELDLWEVSLVTFPMLPEARVGSKSEPTPHQEFSEIVSALHQARAVLAEPISAQPLVKGHIHDQT